MKVHTFFFRITLFLLMVCAMAISCNRHEIAKPETPLSEQQMIDILTDVQIIEADLNSRKSKGITIGNLPQSYYSQLFEHYGITDSIFSDNLRYYTQQPEVLETIMDSVGNRLLQMQSKK